MLRAKFQQFMVGRCGPDQLSLAISWIAVILWLLSGLTGWGAFYILALVAVAVSLFRMFSRNIAKRKAENARFLTAIRPLQRKFSALRTRMRDKDHRYFRCPNCKQQMRVPRGKGRIQVTCRSCGTTFEERS